MSKERDEKGRFVPGNRAKVGKTKQSYHQILRDVLDDTAAKKIIKRAVTDAIDGDARAREWLFGFVMPKLHCVQHSTPPEFASNYNTGNPFDQPASREMALLLDSCQTIEELDVVSKIMDRAQASLPTGNPFEDVLNRPIDEESKALFDSMTPEERRQYSDLMESAAARHAAKPVRPMHRLPGPS